MELSRLVTNMKETAVPRIMRYASQFDDVLYFTMGESDFPSPLEVKKELKRQVDLDHTKYTDEQGEADLRQAIADHYNHLYQTSFTADQILVSNGATGSTYLALLSILNPNDEVILLSPYYSNMIGQVESLAGRVKIVDRDPDQGFKLDIEAVEASVSDRTKALIVNSPSNPMGKSLRPEDIRDLSDLAARCDFYIISDEVYRTTRYEGDHDSFCNPSLAGFSQSFIVDSFSKSLSMTGYRIGYVVSDNEKVIQAMAEFNDWIYGSVPGFIQKAALKGLEFEEEYSRKMAQSYQERAIYLVEALKNLPALDVSLPDATFYLWVDIRRTGLSSEEYVHDLIDKERVALIPGTNYGPSGEGFVRISFAKPQEDLEELVKRMKRYHACLDKK